MSVASIIEDPKELTKIIDWAKQEERDQPVSVCARSPPELALVSVLYPKTKIMRIRITPRNRSLYGFVGKLYVLALSHWRVSGVDGRNRLKLHFLESALPENSDWICENSRSSGKKPNFDPKPRKTRNDSSYQLFAYLRISRFFSCVSIF